MTTDATDDSGLDSGATISGFQIIEKIGAGGMGEVYRARDLRLNREVAIKVLPEGFAQDAERLARFQHEAQVLASLNHPNIAAIYGLEESENKSALVMELVEGPTLADRITTGPLALDEALPIARQITEALERGTLSRITSGGVSYSPVPTPNGERIAYEAVRDGVAGVLLARLDGSGEERLTSTKRLHVPTSWSPDSKTLAISAGTESGYLEVWLVSLDGNRTPQPFLQGQFNVGGAMFSPDGRWVAYVSDESGRNEIYVRSYPEAGTRVSVSANGGTQPVWAGKGRELFFRNGDELLAVDVTLSPALIVGKPRVLFSRYDPPDASGRAYDMTADFDVSADGQRFVMPKHELNAVSLPAARVVLNWFEELKRHAPTGGKAAQ